MRPVQARVVAYARTSTEDQEAGLEAQLAAIERAVRERGWVLVAVYQEHASGRSRAGRPELGKALADVSDGRADALVVTKLDRLTRSLLDFAELAERVPLVVLEQGFDMTTPHGRAMAGMLAVFAQFERELIGERTRAGLAVIRASGRPISRPAVVDVAGLAERIAGRRAAGLTYQAIADELNDDGVPTMRGAAAWGVSAVRGACGYQRPPARRQSPELPSVRLRRNAPSAGPNTSDRTAGRRRVRS